MNDFLEELNSRESNLLVKAVDVVDSLWEDLLTGLGRRLIREITDSKLACFKSELKSLSSSSLQNIFFDASPQMVAAANMSDVEADTDVEELNNFLREELLAAGIFFWQGGKFFKKC